MPITLTLTVGLSFYGGTFIGQTMASGEVYTETTGVWAAVPVEWILAGTVDFWDEIYVEFADGRRERVPILDTGCHLHYRVWDSEYPMGADFPGWSEWRGNTPTGTGTIAVLRRSGKWWTPPSIKPWANEYCNGPLTQEIKEEWH